MNRHRKPLGPVVAITAANLADALKLLPRDIALRTVRALSVGSELAVEFVRLDSTAYVYFPEAGRGGECPEGGKTTWTDCVGLEDLVRRSVAGRLSGSRRLRRTGSSHFRLRATP